MKAFRVGGGTAKRYSIARNVSLPRTIAAAHRAPLCTTSKRNHRSPQEPMKASSWTPHSLNGSSPPTSHGLTPSKELLTPKPAQKHVAYIALGSNLGDRFAMIEQACNMMPAGSIHIKKTSCLWETQPMYVEDQNLFLNGVAEIETTLGPLALLDALQAIENEMGRVKVVDKGPRNIDLDILLYDDQIVDHPRLKIPHPLMYEREFVLRPLSELIPGTALNSQNPWKVTQDYLNDLPPSDSPISTVTPMPLGMEPLRALDPRRRTRVMAILNATPDSFSDGGERGNKAWMINSFDSVADENAFKQRGATLDQSATKSTVKTEEKVILDIGGQSTAPKAPEVSVEEETQRVLRAMQEVTEEHSGFCISVDTYRASVAEAAVAAGAHIINDVSAGAMDLNMLPAMARLGVTVILMHMRGTPATMTKLTSYHDGLIPTIARELLDRVAAAEAAGIRRWRIILDPGIGFAKTGQQNIEILRRLEELREWPGLRGLPWLVGSSRKGFIGKITGVEKPSERVFGTAATVAAAVQGGADIVRVHDVEEMRQVVKMSDAIWRY